MVGSLAGENYLEKAKESPYFNSSTPFSPNELQMHPETWERIKAEDPEFAAMCDVAVDKPAFYPWSPSPSTRNAEAS